MFNSPGNYPPPTSFNAISQCLISKQKSKPGPTSRSLASGSLWLVHRPTRGLCKRPGCWIFDEQHLAEWQRSPCHLQTDAAQQPPSHCQLLWWTNVCFTLTFMNKQPAQHDHTFPISWPLNEPGGKEMTNPHLLHSPQASNWETEEKQSSGATQTGRPGPTAMVPIVLLSRPGLAISPSSTCLCVSTEMKRWWISVASGWLGLSGETKQELAG